MPNDKVAMAQEDALREALMEFAFRCESEDGEPFMVVEIDNAMQSLAEAFAQARLAGERAGMERAAAYISGQATMLRNTYDLAAVQTGLPVAGPTFSAYAVEAMAAAIRKEAASITDPSNG